MKCVKLLLIGMLLFTIKAYCPTSKAITIFEAQPLYIHNMQDPILRAFVMQESGFKENVVNPVSGARGVLQILPVMIKEVNRICKKLCIDKHYTWKDAFNAQKSIEIWYIVQNYHNPSYDLQKACRIWFGRGVQYDGLTWIGYHKGVLKYLI